MAQGRNGNTAGIGHSASGNVYAGANGNVYRHEDGGWSKWDNGSWNAVQRPSGGNASGTGRGQSFGEQNRLDQDRFARMQGGTGGFGLRGGGKGFRGGGGRGFRR